MNVVLVTVWRKVHLGLKRDGRGWGEDANRLPGIFQPGIWGEWREPA